jgi:hypothetical protein
MQAILTKVLPATNTKPTRIKATCERGSVIVCCDIHEQGHVFVARKPCRSFAMADQKRYGTPLDKNPWERPFVTGQLPNGDYAHVFTS